MRRTHQVIAVMMLATALAADRVAAAAPNLRPQIATTARRISAQITRSFREVIPVQRMAVARSVRPALVIPDQPAVDQAVVHPAVGPSHQFRLPPPSL